MLRQTMPKEIICLKLDESTSVLCFVCTAKFLPTPIFHRLLCACLATWSIAKQRSENLIYCGCCVFQLTALHKLILYFRDYVIFVRVTAVQGTDPKWSLELCSKARKFFYENLSRIIGNLGQSLQFEPHVQCPDCNADSLDGLISVSLLQKYEKIPCHFHDKCRTLESGKLLKYWYGNEQKMDSGEETYARVSDQNIPEESEKPLKRIALPEGKIYHVFFSYSSSDIQWVKKTVETLEKDHGFVCCEYDRDNTPGTPLLKFADDSIRNANKTVVVMTREAFKSGFVLLEIQMAITQGFTEKRTCVVPVLLEDCKVPHYLEVLNYIDARDTKKRDIWWPKLVMELES